MRYLTREKKESLKNELIADLHKFIAQGNTLKETQKMAEKLAHFYFPHAEIELINSIIDYAYCQQHMYYANFILNSQVRKYK